MSILVPRLAEREKEFKVLADLAILEERKVLQCRQGFAESKTVGWCFW
jgi:hypothetical protein